MGDIIADLQKEATARYSISTRAIAEIERLRVENAAQNSTNHLMGKRIEELEKESEWKAMKQLLCADYHIIPTDEIRAAWATITEMGDTLTQTEQDWYRAGIVVALGKLNIVRCKGCGGSGSKPTTIDHNMYGKPVRSNLICHDCNGRGWVKK